MSGKHFQASAVFTPLLIYLVIVDQLLFDDLHSIDALRLFQLHQQHLGVATSADHPQQVEVGQAQTGSRFPCVSATPCLRGAITKKGKEPQGWGRARNTIITKT